MAISIKHNKGARIGHQVNNYFDVLGYCVENNIEFKYSKFLGNSSMWNEVLLFRKLYDNHFEQNTTIDLNQNNGILNLEKPKPSTLIGLYDLHRKKLFSEYERKNPYHSKNNICIHIRRGDVNQNNHPDRFLPIIYYKKILSSIYQGQQVYIISEPNLEDCNEEFKKYSPIILKELSAVESFYYMVNSNIFIASKGGFSHLAHILGYSKCYYPKHWCLYRKEATGGMNCQKIS